MYQFFTNIGTLRKKMHKPKKLYSWATCQKPFLNPANLKKHVESIHSPDLSPIKSIVKSIPKKDPKKDKDYPKEDPKENPKETQKTQNKRS